MSSVTYSTCLVLFLALCAHTHGAEKDVVELGDADFQSKLAGYDTALVMFYAPWCGHCKRLKPEFAKAAGDLLANDPPIPLVKVDCTEAGKETCNKFSVSGYPTLKIFKFGDVSQEYGGPREALGIVKYMKSKVGPASYELTSAKQLDKLLDKNEVAIVGFFSGDSDLNTNFLKLADKLREKLTFAHTYYPDVLKKHGYSDDVVVFRPKVMANKFEDAAAVYTGDKAVISELQTFVTANVYGLVGHRTRENHVDFKPPLVVAYYAVDYVKNPKGTNYWRNRVLKVAKEYAQDFTFAVSSREEFQHELNEYGVEFSKDDKPFVAARNAKNQKFMLKSEFSVESLKQFVEDVKNGKLEPYLKSEAIPESNDGAVKVAVGKNFDELVINNEKDVLIEFYAPWCGHCKKLTPIYEELGEKLKDENVEIVKMDATANDVPSLFEVQGFPTLYWLPKNDKTNPQRYEGGREVNDFIKYIAKAATDELRGYDRKGNVKEGGKDEL